jgi:hypothetical protein
MQSLLIGKAASWYFNRMKNEVEMVWQDWHDSFLNDFTHNKIDLYRRSKDLKYLKG